jgi:ElaB/YqjD/DUF883 family membrane-anchored ribosome-binding protein
MIGPFRKPDRTSRLGEAFAIATVAALLAGCGEEAEQVSGEELVSRGDDLCREGQESFSQIQEHPPANAKEAQSQTEELVEVATDELNALRNLRPPDELREAYDRYLEARGSALESLEAGRDAAEDQDTEAYAEAQAEITADQPQRLKLAQAVGFQVCSAEAG